jgi:ribonuclease P protein component
MNHKYSLKKNHDIEKLVKMRRSVGNKYYAIYYAQTKNPIPQFAISPSRQFKTAVERNYEKRVMREILRNKLLEFSYVRLLIVIKTTSSELTFIEKTAQMELLFKKIKELKMNEEKK